MSIWGILTYIVSAYFSINCINFDVDDSPQRTIPQSVIVEANRLGATGVARASCMGASMKFKLCNSVKVCGRNINGISSFTSLHVVSPGATL